MSPVILGQSTNLTYEVPIDALDPSTLPGAAGPLPLILCQTNATGADVPDSKNTWTVIQFTSKYRNEK